MRANWHIYSGVHSALAPASMRTAPPAPVGTMGATAARRMPGMRRTMRVPAESRAPVLPAEIKASPLPSFSIRRPTDMEESFFSCQAVEGLSQISMT